MSLLTELSLAHDNKLPLDLRGRSWTASTFLAHFKQHISMAIHKTAAAELVHNMRFDVLPKGRKSKSPAKPKAASRAAHDLATHGVAGLAH